MATASDDTPRQQRPSPAELVAVRDVIARARAADPRIRNAEELLMCAALALRAGELSGVATRCAAAMGERISKPKLVKNWADRIEQLEQRAPAPLEQRASALAVSRGLLVQPKWIDTHAPGVVYLQAAEAVASQGGQPAKRKLSATSITPHGSLRAIRTEVSYTLAPADGEPSSASKRRSDRHRRREEHSVRKMDLRSTPLRSQRDSVMLARTSARLRSYYRDASSWATSRPPPWGGHEPP